MLLLAVAGEGEGLHQYEGGLEVRRGAEGEAALAVVAFLGGDLGDEADLLADAAVDEAEGVLFCDLGTVADTETAMNAEGGNVFKAVAVGAVFLGQRGQLR